MLVKCSPIVISSYRFIQEILKYDNSNPLYLCNASQIFSYYHLKLQIYPKKLKGDNSNPLKLKNYKAN